MQVVPARPPTLRQRTRRSQKYYDPDTQQGKAITQIWLRQQLQRHRDDYGEYPPDLIGTAYTYLKLERHTEEVDEWEWKAIQRFNTDWDEGDDECE